MYTLTSERLTVKIAEPNKENLTCRFNRAGFITSVVLDGKTEFCGDERGGSGGVGLCSEIQCDPLSNEVPVGGKFPKYGVGILEKIDDRPYIFMRTYPTTEHMIAVEEQPGKLIFTTEPMDCDGYALREVKTVSVFENTVRVDYEIENAGQKELDYSEYVHNFINTEYDGELNNYNLGMPMANAEQPYIWRMFFGPSGYSVTGKDYFVPERHNIWSPGFVISPEIFFRKVLAPGEKAVYAREWTFDCFRR